MPPNDKTISDMTAASSLTGAEVLPVVQTSGGSSNNLKASLSQIFSLATAYTGTLTDAVARTPGGKLEEMVSVLDFIPQTEHAAILDYTSTTDLTTYLQDAINAVANAQWMGLFVPSGLYNFSRLYFMYDATLNPGFPSGNSRQGRLVFAGDGRGDHLNLPDSSGTYVGTVFKSSVSTGDCFIAENNASPWPLKRLVLKDFTLETDTSGYALSTKGAFKCTFSNLLIYNGNAAGSGMLLQNYDACTLDDLQIHGVTADPYSTGRGLYAFNQNVDGSLSVFRRVLVRGFATGYELGLVAANGDFSKFNSFISCGCLEVDTGLILGDRVESNIFLGCQFRGRNYAARTRGRNKYNSFISCGFQIFGSSSPVAAFGIGQGADAVSAITRETRNLLLQNCQFTGLTTGVDGILWEGGSNGANITNINVEGCQFTGDGTGTAITFDGTPTSGTLIQPVFEDVATEISGSTSGLSVIGYTTGWQMRATVSEGTAVVASATDITYVDTGNIWRVTGAVTINTITAPTNGTPTIKLYFTGAPTVQDATTAAGNIRLAGAADFVASANDTLTLMWNGTDDVWMELARSVN